MIDTPYFFCVCSLMNKPTVPNSLNRTAHILNTGATASRAPHARPSRWVHTTTHSRPMTYRAGLDCDLRCDPHRLNVTIYNSGRRLFFSAEISFLAVAPRLHQEPVGGLRGCKRLFYTRCDLTRGSKNHNHNNRATQ